MNQVLSQAEVDALLNAVSDGGGETAAAAAAPAAAEAEEAVEAVPYDLTNQNG